MSGQVGRTLLFEVCVFTPQVSTLSGHKHPRLQPISNRKAEADGAFIGVVINQALAVAGKALDISFDVLIAPQGKTPGTLNRPPAETGLQVIA